MSLINSDGGNCICIQNFLAGKSHAKQPLSGMRRWEDNIETNPRDVDSEDGKLAE